MLETYINFNVLAGIIGILMLVVLYLIVKEVSIIRHINQLSKLVNQIAKDHLENKITKISRGTFGKLERSVSNLINRLSTMHSHKVGEISEISRELAEREAILASMGEGIIVVDNFGKINLVNKSGLDMLGLKFSQVKDRPVFESFLMENEEGKVLEQHERPIWQALNKGKTFISTPKDNLYLVAKNHERFPVSIIATPVILNGETTGAIEIFRDITKEKEVDRAKSEFVSLASHQLRTPLTIIKWYIRTLLDRKDMNIKSQAYLSQVYRTTQGMVELVNAILNVSRIDLGKLAVDPQMVDLGSILDGVLFEFAPQIEQKKMTITKKVDPKTPKIMADQKLVKIIFQNLISNALKYTPKKGTIDILVEPQDKNIVIKVSDTGVGIPKSQKSKIFTKLFRADNAREIEPDGTGLGLYIVKAIVDDAHGEIWFESEVNKGTSFFITLPKEGMKQKTGVTGLT